jgi:fluoroquinolone transport system ATP-binding protein
MITVKNLRYTYPGAAAETIHGMDFTIESGEIFGFLGPSGAGKSTTQKIIIGILKGYQGSAAVMGREISDTGSDYYENIGVSFEFPNLFSKLTARENLNYFRALYSGETEFPETLLEIAGLENDADTPVGSFSKGMKMRLNFVRAFLNRPRLVFLDEPTSGLDPANQKRIKEFILAKKEEGVTVFLTTHNMHVADDLCDRVGFIVDGGLALVDAPRELKLSHGSRSVRIEYNGKGGGVKSSREFSLDGIGQNREFIEIIKSHRIETIHTQEASLEDIFIEVTGRRLI